MATQDYDLKEESYRTIIEEQHRKIDKEYADREKENDLKERIAEREIDQNLEMKQRVFGGSEKENQDKEKAKEINRRNRKAFIEREIASKKQKAEEFAEVQVFGKKWGRLEDREKAYGPDDAIVIELNKQKELADRQKEAERQHYRPSLTNEHKLETLKGKYAQHFNDKDRTR